MTYARSRPGRFVGIASLLTALAGCGAQSAFHSAATAPIISPTPTMVLSAAYDLEGGQREVIFLTAENLSPDEIETLTASLENDLDVDVLPAEVAIRSDPDLPALTPVDPQTGSVGISLTLRRLVEVDTDEYEAVVTYARSGLDGGDIVFQWVRRQDTWEVADVVYPSQS
ncbi:MAG: hypothetical protein ACE5GE_10800 [Phycisphaerae bacterium]